MDTATEGEREKESDQEEEEEGNERRRGATDEIRRQQAVIEAESKQRATAGTEARQQAQVLANTVLEPKAAEVLANTVIEILSCCASSLCATRSSRMKSSQVTGNDIVHC